LGRLDFISYFAVSIRIKVGDHMIRYSLKCDNDHTFDSWFRSTADYEQLQKQNLISCTLCGSNHVTKLLMSPAVRRARPAQPKPQAEGKSETITKSAVAQKHPNNLTGFLTAPTSQLETAMAALRKHVEENSEYVGENFAAEARAIHEGAAPERAIYGEAKAQDARALIEEGVPLAPLPFIPKRKVN
jgi:hypothetical protein